MGRGFDRSATWRRAGLILALAGLSLGFRAWPGIASDWSGGGPEIGWVRSLLQASDGTLYAGTYGGGIFRSVDGGDSWSEATTNARDAAVTDLAEGVDPARTLYAASVDRALLRKEQTSDFWTQLTRFPTGKQPVGVSIETFPFLEMRIAFGSEDGVFMSNNRGAVWPDTLTFARGQAANDLVVLPGLPNTVHALTPLELITTSNSGTSEDFFTEGLAPITYMIDLEPWSTGNDSLLVADQRGPVWQFVERRRFIPVGPIEGVFRSNKYVCRVDRTDGDRILLGSSRGLWRSEDRLKSWSLVDDQMPVSGPEIWAIEPTQVGAGDSVRMGSFTLGFVRTGPGGSAPWTVSNSGLTAAWARTVNTGASGVLCGTAHGRLYRTVDEGASWQDVTGSLRTLQIAVSHDTGTAWIVSGSEGIVRSVDQGVTWQTVPTPQAVTRFNRVVQSGALIYAATNSGLLCSENDGVSFSQVAEVPTGQASFALAVDETGRVAVALDRRLGSEQPQKLYIGYPGKAFRVISLPSGFEGALRGIAFSGADLICGSNGDMNSALYRIVNWASNDGYYVDLAPQIGDGSFEVRDLDIRANVVAIGTTEEGVFLSTDSGWTWSEWSGGLPTRRIESVAFTDSPSRSLWVATLGRGAFVRELDLGVPVLVSGLRVEPAPRGVLVRLAVHHPSRLRVWRDLQGRTVLYDGDADSDLEFVDALPSFGGGRVVYGVDVLTDTGWLEVERIERSMRDLVPPLVSQLYPAVPNPFNPQTSVRFELATAGRVRLEVYDARGRRVRRLIDRDLSAGPHAQSFDGRDGNGVGLASGVYYLLLRAPDRELRGRITLVR